MTKPKPARENGALTLSAAPPESPHETPATTNSGFLAAIFGGYEADDRPMLVGIRGAIGAGTKWPTGHAWMVATDCADSSLNWYFTLSTFRPVDGVYRRRKAQWQRSFGVMLDDIGTKAASRARLDVCPPSYLIETSAGNYQAGYLFDEPCGDLTRLEALMKSLVAAGLCDPGADGPATRLGRLPVGMNGKYQPPASCRLVEYHPERRYSIETLCERLGLTAPTPAKKRKRDGSTGNVATGKSNSNAPVHQPAEAGNPVLRALQERGLYKRPLGDGKHDITCPWVDEHTNQVDHGAAYFEPSDLYPMGGFKCQHAHGDGKRIGGLLTFLGVSTAAAKSKAVIRVVGGALDQVVDAAEQALAAGGRHYQRGGVIVSVVTEPGTGETRIVPASPNSLMRALAGCADWQRLDGRKDDFVPIDPPAKHVNVLVDSESYRHLLVLRGIARQPYLRADGTLMTAAGFDSASGMFGAFDGRDFVLPSAPTKAMAQQALGCLQALLHEFSFAAPHDNSAALAAMLTAAIRPALSVAPMFHIKAPQIASGKSYLSGLIAAFAGPAAPSAYTFPSTEEECAKLLLSALMDAPPVVIFDNLTTDLTAYKSLCSALTEEFLTGRVLGISKTATVPTNTLFLSSGNNVDAVRDMTRRVVTITLDPGCETPATRTFRTDPLALAHANRAQYVSHALTVVRAFLVAGCPPQSLKPLGSYSAWTRLVRNALVWLGLPDPATAVFSRMDADPDRETLGRMLLAWRRAFGSSPTAVRDALGYAEGFLGEKPVRAELIELFRDVAEMRGEINRNRLGRWIARHQGRIVAGLKFVRDTRSGGSERWSVKVVAGVSGGSGSHPPASVENSGSADASQSVEVF